MKTKTLAKLLLAFALFLGLALPALAQSAVLLPNGRQQFLDGNGAPLAGGTVNFYVAPNTTTPKNTWQDASRVTLNTNPVTLDASGEATIYGVGAYRQLVKDAFGTTVWDAQTSGLGGDTYGGVSTGSANAQVLAATDFANRNGQQVSFVAGFTNTTSATINAGFGATTVYKLGSTGPTILSGGEIVAGNNVTLAYDSVNVRFYLLNLPNNFSSLSNGLYNGSIVVSVAVNAMTVSLKTLAGANPSAADPVYYVRKTAAASGQLTSVAVTSAVSTTISSGSTLGWGSGQEMMNWILLYPNGTSSYLLVGQPAGILPDAEYLCSTDNGTGAGDDAGFFYGPIGAACGPGIFVSASPIGVIFGVNATAGTWIAPTFVSAPGSPASLAAFSPHWGNGGIFASAGNCVNGTSCTVAYGGTGQTIVRVIDVMLDGISTNGTSGILFRICGKSSGYIGEGSRMPDGGATVGTSHTNGLFIASNSTSNVVSGIVRVDYPGGGTTVAVMTFTGTDAGTGTAYVASSVVNCSSGALAPTIVTGNGTDVFDAGGAGGLGSTWSY